ncbi:MAG: twin-arginine translocase TatA/TatE family subunit [bacterium]
MTGILAFIRPGLWEIIVILLVVLIVFGAGRLPAIGKALGQAIRGFKKSIKDEEKPSC